MTRCNTFEDACTCINNIIPLILLDPKTADDHNKNVHHFKQIQALLKESLRPYNEDSGIRDFLNKTYQANPLVPKELGGKPLIASCNINIQGFIEQIRESHLRIHSFQPALDFYRAFLVETASFYERRFGKNPLHGNVYFFMKTLEHFMTYYLIQQCKADDIIDIGSADLTYSNIISKAFPGKRLYALDLSFPIGIKEIDHNFYQIGGSAATIPLPDESMDFVCFHCSIEHFEQTADIECIKEVERILRPGGRAVIIPLHTSNHYLIAVNPISGPFVNESFLKEAVEPEINNDAQICYVTWMISRFARFYSAESLSRRLFANTKSMSPELFTIDISQDFVDTTILPKEYFNGVYQTFIPHNTRCFLQFTKT